MATSRGPGDGPRARRRRAEAAARAGCASRLRPRRRLASPLVLAGVRRPGDGLAGRAVPAAVLCGPVDRLRRRRPAVPDPGAGLEPGPVEPVPVPAAVRPHLRRRRLPRPGVRADLPVRGRGQRALPAAGLPGRLLRDPLRRPPQGAAAGGAAGPVLGQLHDAHAGLGEPPGERGHGQPPAGLRRPAGRAVPVAGRPAGHRHPWAGLRLHPLHGPGPVRGAERDRPAAAGGGPGPGGEPAPDLRAWSPCPCPARPSWPGW